MDTPTTSEGLARYDHLPPLDAVLQAWREPGPRPDWHRQAQQHAREAMPQVTAALDDGDAARAVTRWRDSTFMPHLAQRQRNNLRNAVPLVARALDRAVAERRSFTCPRCGAVSHHPEDLREGYCGRCHDFTGQSQRRYAVPWQTEGER